MTIEEARRHVGDGVMYRPPAVHDRVAEKGVITSVSDHFVFVRYGRRRTSAATHPADLELLAAPAAAGMEA